MMLLLAKHIVEKTKLCGDELDSYEEEQREDEGPRLAHCGGGIRKKGKYALEKSDGRRVESVTMIVTYAPRSYLIF
jgi:protein tyrosine phosphatase (PTP) superfamily phosphohydrolase (DUF442 family)